MNINIIKFSYNFGLNSGSNKNSKKKIPKPEKIRKKSSLKNLNISKGFDKNDSNIINKEIFNDNYICLSFKIELI